MRMRIPNPHVSFKIHSVSLGKASVVTLISTIIPSLHEYRSTEGCKTDVIALGCIVGTSYNSSADGSTVVGYADVEGGIDGSTKSSLLGAADDELSVDGAKVRLSDGTNDVIFMLGCIVVGGNEVGFNDVGSNVVGLRDGVNEVGFMLGWDVVGDDEVGCNDVGSCVVG